MCHVTQWVRHPHPKSTELNDKIYIYIFIYYKLVQTLLQIGAATTNQGYCYYKIGQLLQIEAKFITNWSRYYKLGQLLQIGA